MTFYDDWKVVEMVCCVIFSILQRQMDEINTVCKQKYLKKHYLCAVSINDAATNTECLI